MDTKTVADHFNITPKALRRTLRKMGYSAPYAITEEVMDRLGENFTPAIPEQTWLDKDQPMSVENLNRIHTSPTMRRRAASQWATRQAKLKVRLKALQGA